MVDDSQSRCVLRDILKVLQRIETKLQLHEDRFQKLEEQCDGKIRGRTAEDHEDYADTETSTLIAKETPYVGLDSQQPSRKGTPTQETPREDSETARVPYSRWSINHLDRFFNLKLSTFLQKRLGDCWEMPDDNRLPLKFFKSNILQINAPWGESMNNVPAARQPVERELEFLCQFDHELRVQAGNDFMVVDFDSSDNTRLYRLGCDAIGSELEVESQGTQSAPWSRLVLFQGATTGESTHIARNLQQNPMPYFCSTDKIVGLWDHLDYHLQTKRRGTTTNPYFSIWHGFHTNFYEVCEVTEWSTKELWKHGPLYAHPLGWHFRKCAYTLYAPVSADTLQCSSQEVGKNNRYWTLLLLAPGYFFNDKNTSFPMSTSSPGRGEARGYTLSRLTKIGAELHLIGQGLERITQRWADFLSYFDYILDGGDSLMKPAEHDNLLFDDGAFSRSRKYFWAIDCLSEFEISITDNIVQWEQYKAARLPQTVELPDIDRRQLIFADRQYRVLQNQRESFRQKLTSTKALRDALFNASAVIESRASTRLGENVKLLTFVSIFFLPLAFTTSLWSVNDKFSIHTLIYVIIIVALFTYLAMFNINSLAEGFSQVYDIKKKHIVCAMKNDHTDAWKLRGQRFEVFRPKHENPEPSEWYVPLYALMHPMAVLGWGQKDADVLNTAISHTENSLSATKASRPTAIGGVASFFRRRKLILEAPEVPDQPWVIE
ncbi:hypothetical protein ACLMJK_002460 [Lecanora helva]